MTEHDNMVDCREALAKLYEYIDGEIDTTGREAIRAHLEMCRPCLDYFEFEKLFHEFVKRRAPRPRVREEFKTRLFARISAEAGGGGACARPSPVVRHRPLFAMAAAIMLFIGVGAWWMTHQVAPVRADWAQLAELHDHTRATGSSDNHILVDDMDEAVAFVKERICGPAGSFPDARQPEGLSTHEAGVIPFEGGKLAQFEFRDGSRPVSMFIASCGMVPLTLETAITFGERAYKMASVDGFQALCWEDGNGYTCIMMAEADFSTMLAWAESVRNPNSF